MLEYMVMLKGMKKHTSNNKYSWGTSIVSQWTTTKERKSEKKGEIGNLKSDYQDVTLSCSTKKLM